MVLGSQFLITFLGKTILYMDDDVGIEERAWAATSGSKNGLDGDTGTWGFDRVFKETKGLSRPSVMGRTAWKGLSELPGPPVTASSTPSFY